MNSDQIFAVIEQVASNPSRLEKERILKQPLEQNANFRSCLYYIFNPYITFGITNSKCPSTSGTDCFNDDTFGILDDLRYRRLTGNKARQTIQGHLASLTKSSQELFLRILKKDPKAGFSAVTVNKIVDYIPSFSCMLASPMNEKKLKSEVFIEPKFDGVRLLAYISEGIVTLYSRGGKEFFNFDFLKEEIIKVVGKEVQNLILDGELTSTTFNDTVSCIHKKESQDIKAVFNVFDIPSEINKTLIDRKISLSNLFFGKETSAIKVVPLATCNKNEIYDYYHQFLVKGYEGAIVKDPNSLYENKRSSAWLKLKEENTIDLVITSVYEGTGKYQGMLGGMTGVSEDGKLEVDVGTGFSDELRSEFWKNKESLIGRWMEIKYQNETVNDSVRHPRFLKFRDSLGEHGIKE